MNIQQINSSGHDLGVFAVTAMSAVLITFMSWFLSTKTNEYKRWREIALQGTMPERPLQERYSTTTRVFVLVWLVCNSHIEWMLRSWAWLYILSDSITPLEEVNRTIDMWNTPDKMGEKSTDLTTPFGSGPTDACDYVLKFMNGRQNYEDWDPFCLEKIPGEEIFKVVDETLEDDDVLEDESVQGEV